MKIFINNWFQQIKVGNKTTQIFIIMCCSFVLFVLKLSYAGFPLTPPDTVSYFDAGELILTSGTIDILRPPVYSILLFGFDYLFGEIGKYLLCCFQLVMLLVSIYCFYYLAEIFIKGNLLRFFIVLFYSCHPAVNSWTIWLITESLSISMVVFILYFVVKYYYSPSIGKGLIINSLLIIMIMIKPIFLFMIPIIILFWVYMIFKYKHYIIKNITACTGVVLVICLFGIYCNVYKQKYGIFAPSFVSYFNQYKILQGMGLISPDSDVDRTVELSITDFIHIDETDSISTFPFDLKNLPQTVSSIQNVIKENRKVVLLNAAFKLFVVAPRSGIFFHNAPVGVNQKGTVYFFISRFIGQIFNISVTQMYIFLVFYIVLLYVYLKNNFDIPIFLLLLLLLLTIANIFSAVVGAVSDSIRLVVPCIPCILLLFGNALSFVNIKIVNKFGSSNSTLTD